MQSTKFKLLEPTTDENATGITIISYSEDAETKMAQSTAMVHELSAIEALKLGKELMTRADRWLAEHRREHEENILANDEIKRQVVMWLQENKFGSDDPAVKLWLYSNVVNFQYSENGEEHDRKIKILSITDLGDLLSQLPEGHEVLDYFKLIDEPSNLLQDAF